MKIVGIVGWKNSGKTYIAQKIISNLNSRNVKVASVKHAHHNFDIDHPETDSYLHRKSGSQEVIISSSKRWAKISELQNKQEKKLNDLIKELEKPDIVIVEGYKYENHPKIEIIRDFEDKSKFLFKKIKNVIAIISDTKISNFNNIQFKKNQINEIVDFILNYKSE
tara:strand:+ start:27 stop:524 length:498 start_codon:yes stop_codon:yes gene_type:complete